MTTAGTSVAIHRMPSTLIHAPAAAQTSASAAIDVSRVRVQRQVAIAAMPNAAASGRSAAPATATCVSSTGIDASIQVATIASVGRAPAARACA